MSRDGRGADFYPTGPAAKRKSNNNYSSPLSFPAPVAQPGVTSLKWESPAIAARKRHPPVHHQFVPAPPTEPKPSHNEEDEGRRGESGDILNGVGSASSHASTASSVFSNNHSHPGASSIHALTPITNTELSPAEKATSPWTNKTSAGVVRSTSTMIVNGNDDSNEVVTPAQTPPENKLCARPGPGEEKGFRLYYDPALDKALNKEQRAKARKPQPKSFGKDPDPTPPFDPRLSLPGYPGEYGKSAKTKCRPAPYFQKVYPFVSGISVGIWEATQVVVYGFDPLIPNILAMVKAQMGSYGSIAEMQAQTDPITGIPLGICSVRFKDSYNKRGKKEKTAVGSAKAAAVEGSGQRIGTTAIKVEMDKTGRKCDKLVNDVIQKKQQHQERLNKAEEEKRAKAASAVVATPGPPPTAPKGPSGKPPPTGPRLTGVFPNKPSSASSHLIEKDSILPTIKREPFIFISGDHVPIMGTTIAHLAKRMKSYRFTDVRCDQSGYFLFFENNTAGRIEADRCYRLCHKLSLFNYIMHMELNMKGNPNYVRSPSPERKRAIQRRKDVEEKYERQGEEDLKQEREEQAENLEPCVGALEDLRTQLRNKVLEDVKQRIGAPALLDALAPERHIERRRKLGMPDPPSLNDTLRPSNIFGGGMDSPLSKTPDSRGHGFSGRPRHPLAPHDANSRRGRNEKPKVSAFQDERRARNKRRPGVRGLHRQMQGFFGEDDSDSEDEARSHLTRESEDRESRPISRSESAEPGLLQHATRGHTAKRRRLDAAGWGDEEEEESTMDEITARRLLAHLIDKDPEDMAERELEQVLSVLPRSSPIWKKADRVYKRAITFRKSLEEADELFGIKAEDGLPATAGIPLDDDADKPLQSTELQDVVKAPETKKKAKQPSKRKTKKQLLEDQKAAEEVAKAQVLEVQDVVVEEVQPQPQPEISMPEPEEEEFYREDIDLGLSTDQYPRRTVEDDPEILLDLDGWQHLVKDEEDLRYLKLALQGVRPANLGDPHLWAMKQKEIKALNSGGATGIVREEPKIEGYFRPQPSGCSRTEPVKKILESEKSKYLPHRIRVQKAREEREARAKDDPTMAAEAAKLAQVAKTASTASSRSNRANNRRLVNEINVSKQNLADADAMRFNQLKKRKKLVKFDRSAIHNWGLYAEENIAANDMIIEYVGERVRQRVADLRELKYQMQGIGSSYLFRIDDDSVVDATKKGGIARFINHSCMPNCTAKIIKVDGTKRIVIYALRDIARNEELTYDYKFEREINSDDRIPCLCGSIGCKGFLN